MLGSLLLFTQTFFKLRTGKDFVLSQPGFTESHFITLCRELTDIFYLRTPNLLINCPPGWSKSTICQHFIAWAIAHYPDCNFMYISHGHELAAKHTHAVKQIIQMPYYRHLFGVNIATDSSAKDNFRTTAGGTVRAFGLNAGIVGHDAGLPHQDRFSGGVIIDDAHQPKDVHSDTIRATVISNYQETVIARVRGLNVPTMFIGQRLHEEDLAAHIIAGKDGRKWRYVILKAWNEDRMPLYPEVHSRELLEREEIHNVYTFSAQYMQDPQPAGGSLFKPDWFWLTDEEPEMLCTFITADTAETDKTYNDATAFSFWGLYRLNEKSLEGREEFGLHWIDCVELRIEPKDLRSEFLSFYNTCSRYKYPPRFAAIEKKSTGTTLISVLKEHRGLDIRAIERNSGGGSKTSRFVEIQHYVASRFVSLPQYARHTQFCLAHMSRVTANNSHAHDDVCFIGESNIATIYGNKKIKNIKIGDKVITPFGIGNVISCEKTGDFEVISQHGLTGTPNHPIFSEDKFLSLEDTENKKVNYLTIGELVKWRYKKLLFSMKENITLWDRSAIILVAQQKIYKEKVRKDCMLQFGNFIVEKQYKKGMWFIIKMVILLIIVMKIWSVFQLSNICRLIGKLTRQMMRSCKNIGIYYIKIVTKPLHGIKVLKEEHGTRRMLKLQFLKFFMSVSLFVKNVIIRLSHVIRPPIVVRNIAQTKDDTIAYAMKRSNIFVWFVKRFLWHQKIPIINVNEKHVLVAVPEKLLTHPVYNLTVETYGVYYAEGILVSNCDTLEMAVRLALIDKGLQGYVQSNNNTDTIVNKLVDNFRNLQNLRRAAYGKAARY
jgi:hypothetical protein